MTTPHALPANSPDSATGAPASPRSSQATVFAALGILLALLFGAVALLTHSPAFTVLLAGAGLMLLLTAAFALWARVTAVSFEIAYLVKSVHWVQCCVQLSILIALGLVSKAALSYGVLIFYQLCFANIFQILLSGTIKRRVESSFAVFPIVFSINLFVRFQPEFFYFQLLMVAFAVAAKFFIHRPRGGRHVFNPSGFAMAMAIYAILLFYPPHLEQVFSFDLILAYESAPNFLLCVVFVVACISLLLADRMFVTIGALLVMAIAYFGGKLLFGHSVVPYDVHPNVYVGFTLLITDPATSPQKKPAQLLYGAAYGLSVLVGFALLDYFNFVTVFDKILFLPLLNATAPLFDKIMARVRTPAVLSNRPLVTVFYAALFFATAVPYHYFPNCLACFTASRPSSQTTR